jgi:hypothetical protein
MSPEYLAGIFDGEGCIDVQRMYPKSGKGRLYVRPRVRICMANSADLVLQSLHSRFGGHLNRRKATKPNQQDSWSLEWLSQNDMKCLLHTALPHLILKAEQAKLVLWWLDNASGRQVRNTRFGNTECFAGIEKAREVLVEELRAMKQDPQRLSERAVLRIEALMR